MTLNFRYMEVFIGTVLNSILLPVHNNSRWKVPSGIPDCLKSRMVNNEISPIRTRFHTATISAGEHVMEIEYLATVRGASRLTGLPRSTLRSAIKRGEICVETLADGNFVLDIRRIAFWRQRAKQRRRGPKSKTSPDTQEVSGEVC